MRPQRPHVAQQLDRAAGVEGSLRHGRRLQRRELPPQDLALPPVVDLVEVAP
jgi:hypothetical protein